MNKFSAALFSRTLTLCAVLASAALPSDAAPFRAVDCGYKMEFPRDHGSHPDYRTEWWYFTGHIKAADRTFGFELTFFRIGLENGRTSPSAWDTGSIYLAHFALTDDRAGRFYYAENSSRGAFGEAGAAEGALRVWNHDWKASLEGKRLTLSAADPAFALSLDLEPLKPVILQGDEGCSRKGPGPGEASYYSSLTRLEGRADLRVGETRFENAAALAWMDHEFTSRDLPQGLSGWDWFAIQLETGEELMLYRLRRENGGKDPFSSGAIVAAGGAARKLSAGDFELEETGRWLSPETGITYPSGWRIRIPSRSCELELTPTVREQELVTGRSTGVTYWEGRCLVKGTAGGKKTAGSAYAELTGYGKRLDY